MSNPQQDSNNRKDGMSRQERQLERASKSAQMFSRLGMKFMGFIALILLIVQLASGKIWQLALIHTVVAYLVLLIVYYIAIMLITVIARKNEDDDEEEEKDDQGMGMNSQAQARAQQAQAEAQARARQEQQK